MANVDAKTRNWLELRRAAEYLGVHFTTLRRWADAGEIPFMRTPGGHRRFLMTDLEHFLQARTQKDLTPTPLRRLEQPLQLAGPGKYAVRDEPWYRRMEFDQREMMRQEGQQLMAVLIQYAARSEGGDVFLEEGRRLARRNVQAGYQAGLSIMETIRGFTMVRRSITEAVFEAGAMAGPLDGQSWHAYRRIHHFMDAMLLEILERFENCLEQNRHLQDPEKK